MTRTAPSLTDHTLWSLQLLEHRRALLELVIAAFPDVAIAKRTKIDIWRIRLTTSTAPGLR